MGVSALSSVLRQARRTGRMALVVAVAAATLGIQAPWSPAGAEVSMINVPEEIECLALTIYFEARGEPDEGKIAVGHVVMNRALNPLFPERICGVVQQGGNKLYDCQFTWWCDGRSDQPLNWRAWERSKALARRIFWEESEDPTAGALWYHAVSVLPPWRDKLSQGPQIGRHIFYRPPDGEIPAPTIKNY